MKHKNEFRAVLNAEKEAKRQKIQETLNLPQSEKSAVEGAVVSRQEARLAITGGIPSSSNAVATINKKKGGDNNVRAMLPSKANLIVKPKWHPPWKLYRVISGHTGWVRCLDVEPNNEWFATGGNDRIIKVNTYLFFGMIFRNHCFEVV